MNAIFDFDKPHKGVPKLVSLGTLLCSVLVIYSTLLQTVVHQSMDSVHVFYLLLVLAIAIISQSNRRILLITIIVSLVILPVTAISCALAYMEQSTAVTDFVVTFYHGLFSVLFLEMDLLHLIVLLLTFFFVWLAYALAIKLRAGMLYMILGSAIMLGMYLYCPQGPEEVYILRQGLYFMALCLPLAAGGVQDFLSKNTQPKIYGKLYAAVAVVMLLVLFTNGVFMPVTDEQYKSPELVEWYTEKVDSLSSLSAGYNKIFRLKTGFKKQDTEKMGGDVVIDRSEKLRILSTAPIYLRGAVFDQYADNTWSVNDDRKLYQYPTHGKASAAFEKAFDFKEPFFVENKNSNLLFAKETVYVLATNSWDTTVFNALRTESIQSSQIENKELKFSSVGETFVSKRVTAPYNIVYYRPKTILPKLLQTNDGEVTSEMEPYLQLPDTLDPALMDLLQRIINPALSDYENAQLIEDYLKVNYRYTLQPGDVPEGKDFVSYFLLESKQGYCEYAASAFVVLCRLAGIPARYVEGYRVDTVSAVNTEGVLQPVIVTGANAHAWAEVCIQDAGWWTFDSVGSAAFAENQTVPSTSVKPQVTSRPTPTYKPTASPKPSSTPTLTPTPTAEVTVSPWKGIAKGAACAVGLLLLAGLALLLPHWKRKYDENFEDLTADEQHDVQQARRLYGELMWLLQKLGIRRAAAQTAYWFFRESGAPVKRAGEKLLQKKYTDQKEEMLARKVAVSVNLLLFSSEYDEAVYAPMSAYYRLLTKLGRRKYSGLLLAVLWNIRGWERKDK